MRRRCLLLILAAMPLAAIAAPDKAGNSVFVIQPYRHAGTWVFDDPKGDLVKEPFLAGAPEVIDKMVKDIDGAEKGFRLLFAAADFPGATHTFDLRNPEKGGNWYYCRELKVKCWLCPALFVYFKAAPRTIYAKAEAIQKP